MKDVQYIDRASGKLVTESVMGDGALRFAYETLLGRTLWPVLFGSKIASGIMGRFYDSRFSKNAIAQLASIPGCIVEEAEKPVEAYGCFNEFFTRRLKSGARPLGEGFTSPADGRLMLYLNADASMPFPLKGAKKCLRDVVGPDNAPDFTDGRYDIAVVRLAPVDYHRYHWYCPDGNRSGSRLPSWMGSRSHHIGCLLWRQDFSALRHHRAGQQYRRYAALHAHPLHALHHSSYFPHHIADIHS